MRRTWHMSIEVSLSHVMADVVSTHRMLQLSRNLVNFLSQPPHMISWHLDKFHDFFDQIYFLYNLKTTGSQVRRDVSWTWCLKFPIRSWIRYQRTPHNMNIIFWFICFYFLNDLQFKFELFQEIQSKEINWLNIANN